MNNEELINILLEFSKIANINIPKNAEDYMRMSVCDKFLFKMHLINIDLSNEMKLKYVQEVLNLLEKPLEKYTISVYSSRDNSFKGEFKSYIELMNFLKCDKIGLINLLKYSTREPNSRYYNSYMYKFTLNRYDLKGNDYVLDESFDEKPKIKYLIKQKRD